MTEPKDHVENRNLIESILRRIPGFRGYLEKECRRESDQLQRKWQAEAVEALPGDPDQIGSALPSAFDAVDAIEREMEIRFDMLSGLE